MRGFILLLFTLLSIGCSSNKKKAEDVLNKDQVQVDLADKMKPSRIVASFPTYELVYLCTVSAETNTIVFGFDSSRYTVDELVSFLSKEVGVEGASYSHGCD